MKAVLGYMRTEGATEIIETIVEDNCHDIPEASGKLVAAA